MTRKKRSEFMVSVRRKVVERSGNRCERCGINFDDAFKGEFHHITPVVCGGDSSICNCSLLCKNCHYAAPNVKTEKDLLIYNHYFLRFASFREAAQHYEVDNRLDLYTKIALDMAKMSKNEMGGI